MWKKANTEVFQVYGTVNRCLEETQTCLYMCACLSVCVHTGYEIRFPGGEEELCKAKSEKKTCALLFIFCFQKTNRLPSIISIALDGNSHLPKKQPRTTHILHMSFSCLGFTRTKLFASTHLQTQQKKTLVFLNVWAALCLVFPLLSYI